MFKIAFWLGLLAASVFVGGQVIPVYYTNLKVQNVFEGAAENLKQESDNNIRVRISQMMSIQTVDTKSLPKEFFENLAITNDDGKLQIASEYHVILWLLGEPQSVDFESDYKESDVKPMDKLRLRARMDFDFAPFAESQ